MAQDDLGRLLIEAYRTFDEEARAALDEQGLSDLRPSFVTVHAHIDAEGTRVSDLARRAGLSKQAMTWLIEEMEGQTLLRRVDDPDDGRARRVLLTAKGRRRLGQARRVVDRVEARVRRRLGERRHDALRAVLGDLRGAE
ncbi:MAG TPA: MarR family transcriptional regulator [Actinomycetota bacterium]|nr:MarR family transcriptional regulator [Actinomycetota bacterium]